MSGCQAFIGTSLILWFSHFIIVWIVMHKHTECILLIVVWRSQIIHMQLCKLIRYNFNRFVLVQELDTATTRAVCPLLPPLLLPHLLQQVLPFGKNNSLSMRMLSVFNILPHQNLLLKILPAMCLPLFSRLLLLSFQQVLS